MDIRRAAEILLDAILPPRCLVSGEIVERSGQLSAGIWRDINFIAPPLCACCGVPFPFDAGGDLGGDGGGDGGGSDAVVCGACIASPPRFARARAVFQYDDTSRRMILAFKHADRMEGAPAFAAWMQRAGAEILPGTDLIVPVPLHRLRLWMRRYNQAAVLALALGRACNIAVAVDALARVRHTPPMINMNSEARRKNLRGAIRLRHAENRNITGRNILLIDDVLTSGATAEACALALGSAGAARVDVLTLARVVRSGGLSI